MVYDAYGGSSLRKCVDRSEADRVLEVRKILAIITLVLSVGLILNEIVKGMKRILPMAVLMSLACFTSSYSVAPRLFFSDLTDGPISGWEQSDSVGAAVTVWGLNFDTTRGTSYITCGGTDLTADGNYAEWGAHNAPTGDSADFYSSARGLERITFWLDTTMTAGAGSISVTTSEGTSDWIPFYCRELGSNHIYFISRDGSDSDSGFYADTAGHGDEGPWLLASKVRSLEAGDIAYFREGLWTETDSWEAVVAWVTMNHNNGRPDTSIAMVSYPGEIAQLGDSSVVYVFRELGTDTLNHWTIAKFLFRTRKNILNCGPGSVSQSETNYWRWVGNDGSTLNPSATGWGLCGGSGGINHFQFYGNHAHDCCVSNRGDAVTISSRAYSFYVMGYGHLNHMDIGWNEICYDEKGRMQFYGHLGNSDYLDSLYFHDNYIHDMGLHCVICGGGDTGGQGDYEFLRHAWIYNNIFARCATRYPATGGYGILMGGEGPGGRDGEWRLWNNTFYRNRGGEIHVTNASTPDSIILENNIIYADAGQSYYSGKSNTGFYKGNNNCYYNGTDGIPTWDSTGSFETNPLMSNPTSYDFHLQTTSPCIDSGVTIAMTTPDYDGNTRPYGSVYDIGAYEFQGADSLIQVTNLLTTTTTTFSIKDSVKTTYSVTCDSIILRVWSANNPNFAIGQDTTVSDNVDTLVASSLQGNKKYYYWFIVWDEGYVDTTDVDSVITEHPNFLEMLR